MVSFDAISVLWRVLLCLVVTFLPCFAVCAYAIRKGARQSIWLNLLVLAQIGVTGYFVFWLWFVSPLIGRLFSLVLPLVSAAYLVFTFRQLDVNGKILIRSLLPPITLTGTATLLVLSAGFLYGGFDTPLTTAATRFSHPLPVDNELPYYFAVDLAQGRSPKKLYAEWLSSDRPPLQTGIYLSEYTYFRGRKGFEIVSALLQSLWIFALYILLSSLQLNVRAIRLVLATCLFSGFIFLNTFFVWPKLIAAVYVLALTALFLSPGLMSQLRNDSRKAMLGGCFLALALLSHGGCVFSVFGLGLTLLIFNARALLNKKILILLLSALCLYLPWTLYQKIYNPPGDRLLKWMLAGVIPVTPIPFGPTLVQAYTSLSFRQITDNKIENMKVVFDHQADYWSKLGDFVKHLYPPNRQDLNLATQAAADLRAAMFFFFSLNMMFLMFGPLALLIGVARRRLSSEWKAATKFFVYALLTIVAWCLLMFGPATTIMQSGSYANNLVAASGSILAFWAVFPWLAYVVAALQISANFLFYGFFLEKAVHGQSIHFDLLLLWLLSLLALVIVLSRLRAAYRMSNFRD